MNQFKNALCPGCSSHNIKFLANYNKKDQAFLGIDSLHQCTHCGLVFAWPMPSDDQLDKFYRQSIYYQDKAPLSKSFYDFSYQLARSRLDLIFRITSWNSKIMWLDVGAGNAVLGQALKDIRPDAVYDAVEPSDLCQQSWGDWVSASYDDLSKVPREAYDVITANQVLEHVGSPVQFLVELSGHLSQGGHLYIDVPHRDDLFKSSLEPHLLFWEKNSLSRAVKRAGLEIIFCESAGMEWARARRFFSPKLIDRFVDRWAWIARANKILIRLGLEMQFNTFARFQADTYGGERQWLRCLARKTR